MEGRGCPPVLMLEGNVSAHDATLRPRDLLLLKKAKLVIWMGAFFQPFFGKALAAPFRKNLNLTYFCPSVMGIFGNFVSILQLSLRAPPPL